MFQWLIEDIDHWFLENRVLNIYNLASLIDIKLINFIESVIIEGEFASF